MNASNDPLHGKKLADILDELLDYYGGFEGLSRKPWAREKVESLYLYVLRQKTKQKS